MCGVQLISKWEFVDSWNCSTEDSLRNLTYTHVGAYASVVHFAWRQRGFVFSRKGVIIDSSAVSAKDQTFETCRCKLRYRLPEREARCIFGGQVGNHPVEHNIDAL